MFYASNLYALANQISYIIFDTTVLKGNTVDPIGFAQFKFNQSVAHYGSKLIPQSHDCDAVIADFKTSAQA